MMRDDKRQWAEAGPIEAPPVLGDPMLAATWMTELLRSVAELQRMAVWLEGYEKGSETGRNSAHVNGQ